MSEILCSTGAIIGRPNNRDYTLLKKLSGKLKFDGFEFMMYSSWYEIKDKLVEELLDMGLYIPVMHCDKHIGESISLNDINDDSFDEARSLFEVNCEIADKLGAKKLVIHLWDGVTSDNNFNNNIRAYGILKEIADAYGIDLLVENVVCNNENPMKRWCELLEIYPDIHFIFDTKMADFHEQLDLLYEEEYSFLWRDGHIRHYHVNDYGGGYMEWDKLKSLPIGSGHIDFEKFFLFVKKTGYSHTFTVEATAFDRAGSVDINMLNKCFEFIKNCSLL